MTPIGSALLQLLVGSPAEWEYAPSCDGLRHGRTGILLGPSIPDRVTLLVDGEVVSDVLADDDHASLHRQSAAMIHAFKVAAADRQRARLASLLKLEGSR